MAPPPCVRVFGPCHRPSPRPKRLPLLHSDFALVLAVVDVLLHIVTMPIAPITGKLRKRFWLDLTTALGLGVSAGYAFWSVTPSFSFTRHAGSHPRNRYGVHLKRGEHPLLVADPIPRSAAHPHMPFVLAHAVADARRLFPSSSAPGGVLPEARASQAAGVNIGASCNTSTIHCILPHLPMRDCNMNAVVSLRVYVGSRPLAWTRPGAFSEVHPAAGASPARYPIDLPHTRDALNTRALICSPQSDTALNAGRAGYQTLTALIARAQLTSSTTLRPAASCRRLQVQRLDSSVGHVRTTHAHCSYRVSWIGE